MHPVVSVYEFFDVHANFWPVDGSIDYYKYYPGEHFSLPNPRLRKKTSTVVSES